MDFALPQRRTDRHPVGLLSSSPCMSVLGAVLVSARLPRAQGQTSRRQSR